MLTYQTVSKSPGSLHPYNNTWWATSDSAWGSYPTEEKKEHIVFLDDEQFPRCCYFGHLKDNRLAARYLLSDQDNDLRSEL